MSSLVTTLAPRIPASLAAALFWVAVACCVVAQAAILRAAFARTPPPGGAVPPARRAAEVAWAILPAIALAAVLLATWHRVSAERPAARDSAAAGAGALR